MAIGWRELSCKMCCQLREDESVRGHLVFQKSLCTDDGNEVIRTRMLTDGQRWEKIDKGGAWVTSGVDLSGLLAAKHDPSGWVSLTKRQCGICIGPARANTGTASLVLHRQIRPVGGGGQEESCTGESQATGFRPRRGLEQFELEQGGKGSTDIAAVGERETKHRP